MTGRDVPELDRFGTLAAGRQALPIRREGHGMHAEQMALQHIHHLATTAVPETHNALP